MPDASTAVSAPRRRAGPQHDAPVAAMSVPIAWVLLQTAPKLRVLAVCSDRKRLSREMAELVQLWTVDAKTETTRAFVIKPANTLV